MMPSSGVEAALRASRSEPIGDRLKRLMNAINGVEHGDLKNTNRLAGAMTALLRSIKRDPMASADQLQLAADYSRRVARFNPRRQQKGQTSPDELAPPGPPSPNFKWQFRRNTDGGIEWRQIPA